MSSRWILICLVAGVLVHCRPVATLAAGWRGRDPYAFGYLEGYRPMRWPINHPDTPYRVPVYMYGYFGARPRHEPTRNQGFNDYMHDVKRGYVW